MPSYSITPSIGYQTHGPVKTPTFSRARGLNQAAFKMPYFRTVASRPLSNREQPPHYPLLYNITLFNLAIVLNEIAYKAPLEDLLNEDEKRDYENPGGRKYAIPTAAARLVSGIQDQIVFSSYHEVASRCLHGGFDKMKFHEKDPDNNSFLSTKVWIKSYGTALVKPPIGIVTAFAND
jgi:hypothetical protein